MNVNDMGKIGTGCVLFARETLCKRTTRKAGKGLSRGFPTPNGEKNSAWKNWHSVNTNQSLTANANRTPPSILRNELRRNRSRVGWRQEGGTELILRDDERRKTEKPNQLITKPKRISLCRRRRLRAACTRNRGREAGACSGVAPRRETCSLSSWRLECQIKSKLQRKVWRWNWEISDCFSAPLWTTKSVLLLSGRGGEDSGPACPGAVGGLGPPSLAAAPARPGGRSQSTLGRFCSVGEGDSGEAVGAMPAFSAAATDRLPPPTPPTSALSAPPFASAAASVAMGPAGKAVGRDASWTTEAVDIVSDSFAWDSSEIIYPPGSLNVIW